MFSRHKYYLHLFNLLKWIDPNVLTFNINKLINSTDDISYVSNKLFTEEFVQELNNHLDQLECSYYYDCKLNKVYR